MYIIDGKPYGSIRQLAEAYNLSYNTIKGRLIRGISIENALQPVKHSTSVKPVEITYNGKPYKSKSAFCKEVGIKRTTLNSYLDRGMSLSDAVATLLGNKPRKKFTIVLAGRKFTTFTEIAEVYGICISSVINLYAKDELTVKRIKKAKTLGNTGHNGREVTYNDIEYPSYKSLADAFGIKYSLLIKRCGLGWTLDEIINSDDIKLGQRR